MQMIRSSAHAHIFIFAHLRIISSDLYARHNHVGHDANYLQPMYALNGLWPSDHVNVRICHHCIPNHLQSIWRLNKGAVPAHKPRQPAGLIHSIHRRMMIEIRMTPKQRSILILILFSSVLCFIIGITYDK